MRLSRTLIPVLVVLAIPLGMNRVRLYFVQRSLQQSNVYERHQAQYQSSNDTKFQTLLDAGSQSLQNHQYDDALATFKEAEQTTPKLTEVQYTALQSSRRQVAEAYEASHQPDDAQKAYTSMLNSSLQQASEQGCSPAAVAKLRDAEKITEYLTTTRQSALLRARFSLIECLRSLQQYYEAEDVSLRTIEFLRAAADEYDPNLANSYLDLAETRTLQSDWNGTAQALQQAVELYDRTLQHFSSAADSDRIRVAAFGKCKALIVLANAYEKSGDIDHALSSVEDSYQYSSQYRGPLGEREPFSLSGICLVGYRMSSIARRQDLIDIWRERMKSLQNRRS